MPETPNAEVRPSIEGAQAADGMIINSKNIDELARQRRGNRSVHEIARELGVRSEDVISVETGWLRTAKRRKGRNQLTGWIFSVFRRWLLATDPAGSAASAPVPTQDLPSPPSSDLAATLPQSPTPVDQSNSPATISTPETLEAAIASSAAIVIATDVPMEATTRESARNETRGQDPLNITDDNLAELVRLCRGNCSQSELAKELGVSQAWVSSAETGKMKTDSVKFPIFKKFVEDNASRITLPAPGAPDAASPTSALPSPAHEAPVTLAPPQTNHNLEATMNHGEPAQTALAVISTAVRYLRKLTIEDLDGIDREQRAALFTFLDAFPQPREVKS